MAKKRYISDNIWTDTWFEDLKPKAKLLFMYLLTNPLTSISWISEISLKRMVYDTGIEKNEILNIFLKFEEDKKVYFKDWIVVIVNFVKNQNITSEKDNLWKGIQRECIENGCGKLKSILPYKDLSSTLQGAYKGLDIPYLTLLNLTLLNLTENSEGANIENVVEDCTEEEKENEEEVINLYLWELENVKLTQTQLNKLYEDYSEVDVDKIIWDISVRQKIKTVKDFNLTIRAWLRRAWKVTKVNKSYKNMNRKELELEYTRLWRNKWKDEMRKIINDSPKEQQQLIRQISEDKLQEGQKEYLQSTWIIK